jgi:uncharacterized membrane protein YkoI
MSGRRMEVLAALLIAGAALAVASPAGAQAASSHPAMAKKAPARQRTMKVRESAPGLAAQATIKADSAQKLALAAAPGRIREAELEQHNDTLVYSYDIKVRGKSGVEEVLIDAKTGAVVSQIHESAKAEAKEEAGEHRSAKSSSGAKSSRRARMDDSTSKSTTPRDSTARPMHRNSGSMRTRHDSGSMRTRHDSTTKP